MYRKRRIYPPEKAQKHINFRGSNPAKNKTWGREKTATRPSLLGPESWVPMEQWNPGPLKGEECHANSCTTPYTRKSN